MAVLHLSEADVEHLLDMPTTIDAVDGAFQALAAGTAHNVPRSRTRAQGIVLHSMSAAADYLGLVGWKQYTTTASGAKFHVGLHEQETGNLIAMIQADRLGQMRTGAVTGLAARELANPDSTRVGVFGSGWQAESQLEAVATTCPIEEARVYSRNAERRVAFANKMSEKLDFRVIPVDDPKQAVENMPIVVTATTSREPVFDGDWLSPGTLVCAVGSNWLNKAEVDQTTVRKSQLIVCDSIECCQIEAGDFSKSLAAGEFAWEQACDLSEVITNASLSLSNSDNIVLFKSVGMAIEDVAVGNVVVAIAKERGIGRMIDL